MNGVFVAKFDMAESHVWRLWEYRLQGMLMKAPMKEVKDGSRVCTARFAVECLILTADHI